MNPPVNFGEGDEDFEIVDEIRIPNSRAAYEQELRVSHAQFPLLLMPIESQIDRVWEIANAPKNNEPIPIVHSVIENLALGRAITDTAVQIGKMYQYKIDKVHLLVGEFTCVEPTSLEFAFEVQTRNTFLEGSQLVLHPPNNHL